MQGVDAPEKASFSRRFSKFLIIGEPGKEPGVTQAFHFRDHLYAMVVRKFHPFPPLCDRERSLGRY